MNKPTRSSTANRAAVKQPRKSTAGVKAVSTRSRTEVANGKIYVVVAAVVIIVAGLLLYLISLDRKVSKLERKK